MLEFSPTLILRHRKENLKKCSLSGLEQRPDMLFYTYPWTIPQPDLSRYIVLTLDAPVLTSEDGEYGLFLIDGTWRYAEKMLKSLKPPYLMRSLPSTSTAYPRKQDDDRGLASIEALYLAYQITGRNPTGLLDHYHWKEQFLEKIDRLI